MFAISTPPGHLLQPPYWPRNPGSYRNAVQPC
ncbi:hypothetical protein SAMN05216215_1012129 [Saccharopolyspora shandongensis]|uniref:Uncharacterized protein n=1 Tax=Saccharopolyspora shandongensis TaxID=418495 RepID=A0A1H3CRT4_9PSEU|nr:hypothetical protein SAMN05216215_1012129 [Saccharopolyspora shandongensis]